MRSMANIVDKIMYIDNYMDLEAEMYRYNCQTIEDLNNCLRQKYNVALVLNKNLE